MVDLYTGHIIPGTGYFIYAFWWSLTTAIRFSSNKPYRSSVAMPALFLPTRILQHPCFESSFRFVCSLVGLIFHPIDAQDDYHKAMNGDIIPSFKNIGDRWDLIYRVRHHFALYLVFALGSFVEVSINDFDLSYFILRYFIYQ